MGNDEDPPRRSRGKRSVNLTQALMSIIAENGLDLYLYKQNKTRDLYDKHLISCIFRGLDKDMDGRVSILDFVKSLSKTFSEEKRNIEVTP